MNIKTFLQFIVPQHLISRWMGAFTRCQIKFVKQYCINKFIRRYGVDMQDAVETNPTVYPSFQAFFTRAIKLQQRPIDAGQHSIVSPVDGTLVEKGLIQQGSLIQAKGFAYSVAQLLGGDTAAAQTFMQGQFASFYLSPKDYHRVHMPLAGTLQTMRYVPGQLFSVNAAATNTIPNLLTRNERVVCWFDTDEGPMAVILIGALFVGSINTRWQGSVTPCKPRQITNWHYYSPRCAPITLEKGEELGYFNMGSAVTILMANPNIAWTEGMQAGNSVKMGMRIAEVLKSI